MYVCSSKNQYPIQTIQSDFGLHCTLGFKSIAFPQPFYKYAEQMYCCIHDIEFQTGYKRSSDS